MGYGGFDLSKSNTGWALWEAGWAKPVFGSVELGSSFTSIGQTCIKLHQELMDLHTAITPLDWFFSERPNCHMQTGHRGGKQTTSESTILTTLAIWSHLHSFAHAVGAKPPLEFGVDAWRIDFVGRFQDAEAKAEVRRSKKAGNLNATARPILKKLTIARCKQLGINVQNDDQADAVGVLTAGLLKHGIQPPWLANEVLREPLVLSA